MRAGDAIFLEVCDTPGRRQWIPGRVVSVGKVWVTVAVECTDGTTARVRVNRADVVRQGAPERGAGR